MEFVHSDIHIKLVTSKTVIIFYKQVIHMVISVCTEYLYNVKNSLAILLKIRIRWIALCLINKVIINYNYIIKNK